MSICGDNNGNTAASSCRGENSEAAEKPACCGGTRTFKDSGTIDENVAGFQEWLSTPAGNIARISSRLTLSDHLGACKARWAISRMSYYVPAGLYAIGTPSANDPVVVTANYKMTYDILRSTLSGRSLWLLALETYGINVWCAAGKGTFGTKELVKRIETTGLARVVAHRNLIVPILGAPGIAAHKVRCQSSFTVNYSTIRASDLPEYLDNGMRTTPAMRELTFSLYDRLVLIPVEIVLVMKTMCIWGAILFAAVTLVNGVHAGITALAALGGSGTDRHRSHSCTPSVGSGAEFRRQGRAHRSGLGRRFSCSGRRRRLEQNHHHRRHSGLTCHQRLLLAQFHRLYRLHFALRRQKRNAHRHSHHGMFTGYQPAGSDCGQGQLVALIQIERLGMKGFRYLENVVTLRLDAAKCTGCLKCEEVCPHQVFRVVERKARIIDRDACLECGACAINCPVEAIRVDAGVGCAIGLINEWLKQRKAGGFGGGFLS